MTVFVSFTSLMIFVLIALLNSCVMESKSINVSVLNDSMTSCEKKVSHCHDKETTLSGRKCRFIEPSRNDMELIVENMTTLLQMKQKYIKFATGGEILVYFHILMSVSGKGHVTSKQIFQQMNVLNNAFSFGGWKFVLGKINYVVDDNWYQDMENDVVEVEVKRALRRGTGEVLNVYSANLRRFLGWAYLPNIYGSVFGHYDGVVIHHDSFPGGSFSNYNHGDTGIQF